MSNLAAKLPKGTKVKITTKGQFFGQVGTVKYVGPIEEKKTQGDYVGLELEKPIGKNNGTHGGKEYFKTKQNYGIFLKPTSLARMDGTPVVPPSTASKTAATSNKLSKDLQQASEKIQQPPPQQLKRQPSQKLQEATSPTIITTVKTKQPKQSKETKQTKQTKQKQKPVEAQSHQGQDHKAELQQLKKKNRALEQQIRTLRIDNQKVKYAVKEKDQGQEKQLQQKIDFFKAQKEAVEKQNGNLKKKNAQLNAELEEYAENMGMVDNLTIKIQNLQAKNEKLKQELEAANTELKTLKMTSGNSSINEEELNQNIRDLNQMVTLLQSDLKEMTDKNTELSEELKKRQASQGEAKKLQRKLKQKQQQIEQMANQLQLVSDAAAFAQKLTLDMLKKDEQLKQTTVKLNQYLNKVQILEGELALNKQIQDEFNQQMFHQDELMDKFAKEVQEKNKQIAELNKHIQKYKKKIFELTQTNDSTISMNSSQIQDKQELTLPKSMFGDQYQNKYYNALKVNNEIKKNQLKYQIQFSQVRNQVGVYMLNLNEALPQSFTSKLYPEVINTLTAVKSANDKLYYIFTTIADNFLNKSDIYSKENAQLTQWLIILMNQAIQLYGCLHKIQYSFTTAESQQQISQILDHRVIREQIRKVNTFALEILQRFVDDNISSTIDLEPFITSIQNFDVINLSLKRHFSSQYDTKMRLCIQGMQTISNILQAITKYKHINELGENAQVDSALQQFIRTTLQYLKECCMNPYIRIKSQMKKYLQGLQLIKSIFSDIGIQGNYHQLSNLYSETQNIKLLKETIFTTQYHVNQLENDLKDIVYTSEVSKIQTQLPGKFWQERIKLIKQQLLRVKQISEQKAELQQTLTEAKKKNLLLERDLKDKQSTKQLYERRIGELQLKVQQTTAIQNQNKRQAQKIKSYQDANKIIQEQIVNLTKKYKLADEQSKKIKQKYDTLQTQTMMRNKKQKNLNTLSSQDVANLTIFKNSIKQSNQLRSFDLKKKMMSLKQSPIFALNQTKIKQQNKIYAVRSKAFDQISKFTINDPFVIKKNPNEACLDTILLQIDKLTEVNEERSSKNKSVKVGTISVSRFEGDFAKVSNSGLSIVVN